MALQDIIAKRRKGRKQTTRGPGGVLAEQDIQNLSKSKDLAAPPLTPAGAAGIGATPDQAKMIGDARQKQAALQQAVDPEDTLQGRLRRKQARTEATAEEMKAREKSASLQALKGLGDRVGNIVSGYMAQPEGELQEQSLALTPESMQLEPTQRESLQAYAADPTNTTSMIAAAEAMGYTPDDPELADKLMSHLSEELQGSTVADQIRDTVDVTQLITGLETDSPGLDIHDLLGLAPGDIKSVQELQDAVDRAAAEEFERTEALKDIATNPNASRAERQAAAEQLRDLGAVGVRATEDEVAAVNEAVETAEEVEFMGKTYSAEELLSDDTIEGLVKEFIELDPNDPDQAELRQKMADQEPDFFGFVQEHEKALEGALAEAETEATKFADIQIENAKIASTDQGNIPKELMEALIPGYGGFATETYEQPELLTLFDKDSPLSTEQKSTLMTNLTELAADDPQLLKAFASTTPERLEQLGVYAPPGDPAAERWSQYKTFRSKWKQVEALDPKDGTYHDQIARILTGNEDITADTLKQTLRRNKLLGVKSNAMLYKIFSGDPKWGEDPSVYLKKYGQWTKPENIMSGATYGEKGLPDWLSGTDETFNPTYTVKQEMIRTHFGKAIEDGQISRDEWKTIEADMKGNPKGIQALAALYKNKIPDDLRGWIDERLPKRYAVDTELKELASKYISKGERKKYGDPYLQHEADPKPLKKAIRKLKAYLERVKKTGKTDMGLPGTTSPIESRLKLYQEWLDEVTEARKRGGPPKPKKKKASAKKSGKKDTRGIETKVADLVKTSITTRGY
jgi:hypothetical protein